VISIIQIASRKNTHEEYEISHQILCPVEAPEITVTPLDETKRKFLYHMNSVEKTKKKDSTGLFMNDGLLSHDMSPWFSIRL
jgi:hypothetical protein